VSSDEPARVTQDESEKKIRDVRGMPSEVRVDNPSIRSFLKQCAKDGRSKDDAVKLSGVPGELVDKIYKEHREGR